MGKKGSQVGEMQGWKDTVLLTAYVSAIHNGYTLLASKYAEELARRKVPVPQVRLTPVSFGAGATKTKIPRTVYGRRPDWSLMVYSQLPEKAGEKDDVLGPYPVLGHSEYIEKKFLQAFKGELIVDKKHGNYTLVEVPLEVLTKYSDLVTYGGTQVYGATTYAKKPLMCVYDATKNYCESILGIRLNYDDEKFFIDHPLVAADGVPFPDTLRVVQELVAPYGVGIMRVRMAPGYNLKGDIAQWRSILGVNPLAMADRSTSNAQFIEQSPNAGDPDQWRFEYREDVLRPAISCGISGLHVEQAMTGSTNGHATYNAPRSSSQSALLSFQLARMDLVKWRKMPVFGPIEPKKEPKKPEPELAMTEDVFEIDKWSWDQPHTKAVTVEHEFSTLTCCNRHTQHQAYKIPGVCDGCWDTLSEHMACQDCALAKIVVTDPPFAFHSFDWQTQSIEFTCTSCKKLYHVTRDYEVKKARGIINRVLQSLKRHADDVEVDRMLDEHRAKVAEQKLLPSAETSSDEQIISAHEAEARPQLPDEFEDWWRMGGMQ